MTCVISDSTHECSFLNLSDSKYLFPYTSRIRASKRVGRYETPLCTVLRRCFYYSPFLLRLKLPLAHTMYFDLRYR
jgi:hypothetical protein